MLRRPELAAATAAILILFTRGGLGLPSLHGTPAEPVFAVSGEEAIIECEAKNTDNYTVIWQRLTNSMVSSEILTAGTVRVTNDRRFAVIHESGSDLWALRVGSVTEMDGGRYICEVNSVPRLHVIRVLAVQSNNESSHYLSSNADNTGCCMQASIPLDCLQFCSLHSVLARSHPNPWHCMDHLPTITRCLTDGRNHMPCCVRQNIPEICRSVCVGDYELSSVIQHYSCMNYTVPTLACIAEGVEILPGPPQDVFVEPVSSNELRVLWAPPSQSVPVTQYWVNITKVHSLGKNSDTEMSEARKGKDINHDQVMNFTKIDVVSSNLTEYSFKDLQPDTVYEVKVTSVNDQGQSMPTYAVRTVTPAHGEVIVTPPKDTLNLTVPDIRQCCIQKGVEMGRCLDNMCDLTKADEIRLTDVMICAPWANLTFECMSGNVDHSVCCKQRDVPEVCLDFCRGKVQRVDYRHFVCLEHMESYGNCLLEHYGVLTSPPEEYSVRVIHSEWALVQWKPPKFLKETVTGYSVHWREIENVDGDYSFVVGVKSPYLLDGLLPGVQYESYVVATNRFGTSQHSTQVVFTSAPAVKSDESVGPSRWYNETACCVSAGLHPECMPLCTYEVKLTDMYTLGPRCSHQLDVLLRCAAGGRDHTPCCRHRAVTWDCLPLCSGTVSAAQFALGTSCGADLGKVLQCMVEGMEVLPGIPEDLHTVAVTPTSVHLTWNQAAEGKPADKFQVRYEMVEQSIPPHPLNYNQYQNTTNTSAVIEKLKENTTYSFYVVAGNVHGFSQPSLVIVLSTSDNETNTTEIRGGLGPPHSLEVLDETATSIALRWMPPLHAPADSALAYTVYYQPVSDAGVLYKTGQKMDTRFTSAEVGNLTESTQYIIAVRAAAGETRSFLSEALLAWTEAPTPAFVNPPLVIPAGPIVQGKNVTIMCIAMGTPAPTVSLYVNGEVVVEKKQHHVAYTLHAIQHNISNAACFADNGHGQGAYSAVEMHVSFPPMMEATVTDLKTGKGRKVKLQCRVQGFPEPHVTWFKGANKDVLIQRGSRALLELEPDRESKASYFSSLTIPEVFESDSGEYLCIAENILGSSTSSIRLSVEDADYRNTSVCCLQQRVSNGCLDACTFDIDMQLALDKPECIQDLDKLMFCAADGRDHRQCCRDKGVPRKCRRWCKGRAVNNAPLCALVASKEIVGCFEQGKAVLPGPPLNVHVEQKESNVIQVHWEPPATNPDAVQWYRVFWRPIGSKAMFKNQTQEAHFQLDGLDPGATYEVAIKSGNHYGLSIHTTPIVVTLQGPGVKPYAALVGEASGVVKAVVAVIVLGIIMVVAIVGAFLYLKKKRQQKQEAGVSFENPAYLKDSAPATQVGSSGEDNCVRISTQNGSAVPVPNIS